MFFEKSLLTQVSVENPLPTLVEVEISRSLNTALKRAFHFFYILAAEKVNALAPFIPYGEEMYLALHALLEQFLIFNADTTFTELMFGLRRVQVVGPKPATLSSYRDGVHGNFNLNKNNMLSFLRFVCFGPSPMPSAEERAMDYVALQHQQQQQREIIADMASVSEGSSTRPASSAVSMPNPSFLGAPTAAFERDQLAAMQTSATSGNSESRNGAMPLVDGSDHYNADELMTASRASYGYLKFSPLSRQQRVVSLLLLTVKPYLEHKVKMLYLNEISDSPDVVAMREAYAYRFPVRARLKKIFYGFVFPLLHLFQKSSELLFKLLYLCELTPYTSPFHRVFNLVVKRESIEEASAVSPRGKRALNAARLIIFVVFFGFQLFEFSRSAGFTGGNIWGTDDGEVGATAALPIPPPPAWGVDVKREAKRKTNAGANQTNAEDEEVVDADPAEVEEAMEVKPGQCPVCKKPITNVAVLATTGVLGCYPCLQQFVREHLKCPVTSRATSVAQIRRVYEG